MFRVKVFLLIISLTTAFQFYGQSWKWAHSDYSYGSADAAAFDKSGNLFVSGANPVFIEKFNPSGDSLWLKYTGLGVGMYNMALDSDTSIFLVGNGYTGANSVIIKCDKEGNVLWDKSSSSTGLWAGNFAYSIAIDSHGNSFASGVYNRSAGFGISCVFTNPAEATFIVKLSPSGDCLWSMDIPNGGNSANVTVDLNDDLIISTPDSVLKVSNNIIQWRVPINELNSIWHQGVSEVNTDSDNNIYFVVVGDSIQVGTISHRITPNHGLLVKLSSSGSIIWTKEISGPFSKIFIGNAIYMTDYYDTGIQKISLNGDSIWCRNLTSSNSNFHIRNITGSDDGLIAITGILCGYLLDGNDTILKSHTCSPFVAILEDSDSASNIINKSESDFKLSIYPNPTSGAFSVNLNNYHEVVICVFDVLGNCLLNKKFRNESSPKIDLSRQPKGIYFMEMVSDGKRSVNKIVLQ